MGAFRGESPINRQEKKRDKSRGRTVNERRGTKPHDLRREKKKSGKRRGGGEFQRTAANAPKTGQKKKESQTRRKGAPKKKLQSGGLEKKAVDGPIGGGAVSRGGGKKSLQGKRPGKGKR